MTDQNTFMETVNSVKEIMRVAEVPMSEAEILAYFADMDLDEQQKQLVLAYLLNPENAEEASDITEERQTEEGTDNPDSAAEGEEAGGSKVFQMYLEELATLPKYSREEKAEFYEKLLQGDSEIMETILVVWLEKILNIAQEYMEPKLNVEDLVQEGNMALVVKLQELLGSRAEMDIEEELAKAVEEGIVSYVSGIRDERELEDALVGKVSLVHAAKKLLTEEKGHAPTMEELSGYTKMTVEELNDLEDLMKEGKNELP